ncbi:MAG: hypothetical protein HY811_09380 [Planctomycetes bacterium]|nr:hypothetical protein [Planctomycetota bacterium]
MLNAACSAEPETETGDQPISWEDMVRYTLNDQGGELRFVDFEVLPPLKQTQFGSFLLKYFPGRALKEVRREDIPSGYNTDRNSRYGSFGVFDAIINLKKLLCC